MSRPLERIVAEAVRLQEMGIKEIMLIAQDSTDYGYDFGMKNGLNLGVSPFLVYSTTSSWKVCMPPLPEPQITPIRFRLS